MALRLSSCVSQCNRLTRMPLTTKALLCKQTINDFRTCAAPWRHLSSNCVLFVPHCIRQSFISLYHIGSPLCISHVHKGGYLKRNLARWKRQYEASKTHEIEAMDNLIAWLEARIPSNERCTLAHGDFRYIFSITLIVVVMNFLKTSFFK